MRKSLASRLSRPGIGFARFRWSTWISVSVLAAIVLAVVFASVISPYDPLEQSVTVDGPSAAHPLGQDSLGRDILSRLLYGGRWSLSIGLASTAIALVLGALLGAVAATSRKGVDETIMRILDVVMAFPGIALAAVFVAVFGGSIPVLIATIGFLYTPMVARIVRANVISQFGEDYVAAERAIGASQLWIVVRHVASNVAAPIMVFCTVLVADAIVFEASLSFIGAGVRPPDPSWGSVIADGKNMVLIGGWWATVFPGLLILITVLSLNVISEGVSDALANPRLRTPKVRRESHDSNTTQGNVVEAGDIVTEPTGMFFGTNEDVEFAVDETPLEPVEDEMPTRDVIAAEGESRIALLRVAEESRTDRLVMSRSGEALLEVRNLSIRFPERYGDIAIVDDVSFTVRAHETMALVGESGCGKSLTALAIMGLLPRGAKVSGEVLLGGVDLLSLSRRELNRRRGHELAMVYQDALSSLNPAMQVRAQLGQLTRRGGKRRPHELLELVGLDAERTLRSFPHELSGGQRQRVLIAMALTRNPRIIVADEPTTALDVTVQAQVVGLLNELRESLGFAMVFVSHDLALVASLAHRVTVMYAGQIVETGRIGDILKSPSHEYTKGLLNSVLSLEANSQRLHQIPGSVPAPSHFTAGDRFASRSVQPSNDGLEVRPMLVPGVGEEHFFASSDLGSSATEPERVAR